MSSNLERSAGVPPIIPLVRKLSVHLQRLAGCWSNFSLLRKLSVHLHRSAGLASHPENCQSTCIGLQVEEHSVSRYSENCPFTCKGRQVCFKIWKKYLLLRKLSNHLQPLAGWELYCTPAKVSRFNRSYFCGSTCQVLQVYGQSLNLPMVSGVLKCIA